MDASRSVMPTRRTVLGGSATMMAVATGALATLMTALTSGCTSVGQAEAPPAGPEVILLNGVIDGEAALIALYDAVLAAHQGLADRLKTPRDHHVQHLAVLKRHYVPGTATGTATPAPRPAATAPGSMSASLSAIRSAERKAAAARADEVRRVSPGLAQLLAAIGACEAGHVQELA